MILHKDCRGNEIKTGAIVKHDNRKGIIFNDEIEGQYVKFKNGLKLRVKDYANKLRVVGAGVSKEIERGLIIDGIRRY